MESLDSLAELRGEEHAGSLSSSTRWGTDEGKVNVKGREQSFSIFNSEGLVGVSFGFHLWTSQMNQNHHKCLFHSGKTEAKLLFKWLYSSSGLTAY